MPEQKMPNNAEDWAQFLVEKPLPSPFQVGKQVLHSIQGKNLPYAKIAEQANSDPVLSCSIMSKANKEREEGNARSKTLDHAISMIGIDQLKKVIHQLPFQDSSSEDIKSFYYVRSLCSSLYAAHLGRSISEQKSWGNPEEIYWSSLFLGVPAWQLWRHATPEMRLIQYAVRSNFKLPETAEREVLGCTILEVSTTLVQALDLPDLVNSCYLEENQLSAHQWVRMAHAAQLDGQTSQIEDKALSMHMQSSSFPVMLANLIAQYATHDWYSRACLRSQRILATYLKIPLSEAIGLSHQAAASMSRKHPLPGVMLPAAKLFLPTRKRTRVKSADEMSAGKVGVQDDVPIIEAKTPEVRVANKPADDAVFDELTAIMLNKPEEFNDLHELMNAATQGLAYSSGMERATVYLINKDRSRIKTYYHAGCRAQSEFSEFDTKLIPNTIFAKLVERPASVWIKPSSDDKIAKLIPMNFKQVIEVDTFFLMSVFVNKRPVAIFYADNFQNGQLGESQYKQFKHMCGAVGKALKHQAASRQ